MNDTGLTSQEVSDRAEEAYIYAFPMLMGYRFLFGSFLAQDAPSFRTPINTIASAAQALDYRFKDVISPNADTPYTFGALDLRAEPYVLSVPEVSGRYYVMQLEDLLGFNEHYIGTRATGDSAGSYLLAGPRWAGDAPTGISDVLRFETDIVFILGRTQLLGSDDTPALMEVQEGYKLRALSEFAGTAQPTPALKIDWPTWNDEASRDERFLGYLAFLLGFCEPIHGDDAELIQRMRDLGVEPGGPFNAEALDAGVRDAIHAGVAKARASMSAAAEKVPSYPTGWTDTDVFGDRAFFDGDYLTRAVGAQLGWGGNDKIEAFYPMQRADADGDSFDGSKQAYEMTWESDPPNHAFWSVTMYDMSYDGSAGYLVKNPIDRYLINSTTEGLRRGASGSLTMHIQHERPEGDAATNWLPAPAGPFYLILRVYVPDRAALDGSWVPPAVTKA